MYGGSNGLQKLWDLSRDLCVFGGCRAIHVVVGFGMLAVLVVGWRHLHEMSGTMAVLRR